MQDAALLAFRGFGTFQAGTNFKAWFFKILMNCFYSKHRRQRREPVTFDVDDTPDLFLYARSHEAGFPTTGPDPAGQLFERLGTVRSRLHRGRKMLQKALWQVAVEAGIIGGRE